MNKLKFNNGRFRILQLSDMQDTHMTNPDTINLTAEIIKNTNPDLIVLTGDQVKGYGFYFLVGDNKTNAATTISNLMQPIADSKIPFTAVFGNHDAFGTADKDFQWKCYGLYDNFIGQDYTFDAIPIYSENGEDIKFGIYMFDSHEKNKDGTYNPITAGQIDRYKAARDEFEAETGHTVSALAFQHIPPEEIYECFEKSDKSKKGFFQGAGIHNKKHYSLPSYAKNKYSFMGENAASPNVKSGQIEAFKEKGDVLGLFFGHDHNNSFVLKHDNLDLGYTQGCGFNIYGPGKKRGGRVFDIYETTPDTYYTYTVTCNDIEGFKLERPVKEFIYTHSPSSVTEGIKLAKKVGIIAGTVAATAIIVKKIIKKK